MVLNKTFGDLRSSVAVGQAGGASVAKRFVYSNANLGAIVAEPEVRLKEGAVTMMFPAASVTLLVFGK
jgi:hypothetical protein